MNMQWVVTVCFLEEEGLEESVTGCPEPRILLLDLPQAGDWTALWVSPSLRRSAGPGQRLAHMASVPSQL